MNSINNLGLSKIDNTLFCNKAYKFLDIIILVMAGIFSVVYAFRTDLYGFDNQLVTLFAWTAPNLIPSFLLTLIGVFYIVPMLYKTTNVIINSIFIGLINILNVIIFSLIEYLHVIFKLSVWDNKDMIASLIGTIVATTIYFKLRKLFIN